MCCGVSLPSINGYGFHSLTHFSDVFASMDQASLKSPLPVVSMIPISVGCLSSWLFLPCLFKGVLSSTCTLTALMWPNGVYLLFFSFNNLMCYWVFTTTHILPSSVLFLSFLSWSLSWASDPCIKYMLDISIWITNGYFNTNYTSELRSFHSLNVLTQTHPSLTQKYQQLPSHPSKKAGDKSQFFSSTHSSLSNQSSISIYHLNNHKLRPFSPSLLPLL